MLIPGGSLKPKLARTGLAIAIALLASAVGLAVPRYSSRLTGWTQGPGWGQLMTVHRVRSDPRRIVSPALIRYDSCEVPGEQ